MKRPPGIWFLLTIAAIWLCIQDVDSVRATSLIFAKTTTTTTSTEATPEEAADGEQAVTEVSSTPDGNTTKPTLTGIPQIDYIWDPNLPRELNGYNLSEYPFYDGLPIDIDFKCDGLHDGFYASIPHKCQVYHHCLYGTRFDFLCANYTAFDQKTFICQFVSVVDCVNSKNFWHRNDDLYQAASTTTVKPTVVYTPPPAPATSVPIQPILGRRPGPGGRRPGRPSRRRPQYDYYEDEYDDDYYEERRVKKRPRYRPRPVYDDEEEEYEDDAYPKRRPLRRKKNEGRRRNNEERRKQDDEDYVEEEEDDRRRPSSERRNPESRKRPSKRRPAEDEEYDRRSYDRPNKRTRKPVNEEEYADEDPPPRRTQDRRKNRDEDVEEERPRRSQDDRRKGNRNDPKPKTEEAKPKPALSPDEEPPLTKAPPSVYERKRPPPKIRPPVPISEQSKFSPKSKTRTTTPAYDDEEYYDDYEEPIKDTKKVVEEETAPPKSTTRKPPKRTYVNKRKQAEDDYEEEEELPPPRRPSKRPEPTIKDKRVGSGSRKRPIVEEYEDYEDTQPEKPKEEQKTSTTTREPPKQRQEPIVKVVKRPFLPSRGGNPYTSRGLLPVGLKAEENAEVTQKTQESRKDSPQENNEEPFKLSSSIKPRAKYNQGYDGEISTADEETSKASIKPRVKYNQGYDGEIRTSDARTNRPVSRVNVVKVTTTTTTENPTSDVQDPLDIDENEYDVTLNDALNPTIPNLPVRNFPTGFSSSNDYNYNTPPRQRYVADPTLNQASSDFVYRIEPAVQSRYVPVYQPYRQSSRQQTYFSGI